VIGRINLEASQKYPIVMEYYENGGGAVAQLLWEGPYTSRVAIPQAALSPPLKAYSPNPTDGSNNVALSPTLSWQPGTYAASHDVYYGTNYSDDRFQFINCRFSSNYLLPFRQNRFSRCVDSTGSPAIVYGCTFYSDSTVTDSFLLGCQFHEASMLPGSTTQSNNKFNKFFKISHPPVTRRYYA
jgi:hypothetical protein